MRALLQGENCPDALKSMVPLLEKKWAQDRRMGTIVDVNHLGDVETHKLDNGKQVFLLTEEYKPAFEAGFKAFGKILSKSPEGKPRPIRVHKRVIIGGRTFASHTQAVRDTEFFFKPLNGEQLVPGVITGITSLSDDGAEVFVLSILCRKRAPSGTPNPFLRYPDFGAELWSAELEKTMVRIPTTQPIYHSQSRLWAQDVVVTKPITPVSEILLCL